MSAEEKDDVKVNSLFAAEAGEGPVSEASEKPGHPAGRQEGTPTILSHDLGDQGFDKEHRPQVTPTK